MGNIVPAACSQVVTGILKKTKHSSFFSSWTVGNSEGKPFWCDDELKAVIDQWMQRLSLTSPLLEMNGLHVSWTNASVTLVITWQNRGLVRYSMFCWVPVFKQ